MTFSDPTTVTVDLDIDLSDPRHGLAEYYVITADAIFSDRWGNNTGMFSAIDYVSLQLDRECSKYRICPLVFYLFFIYLFIHSFHVTLVNLVIVVCSIPNPFSMLYPCYLFMYLFVNPLFTDVYFLLRTHNHTGSDNFSVM